MTKLKVNNIIKVIPAENYLGLLNDKKEKYIINNKKKNEICNFEKIFKKYIEDIKNK